MKTHEKRDLENAKVRKTRYMQTEKKEKKKGRGETTEETPLTLALSPLIALYRFCLNRFQACILMCGMSLISLIFYMFV